MHASSCDIKIECSFLIPIFNVLFSFFVLFHCIWTMKNSLIFNVCWFSSLVLASSLIGLTADAQKVPQITGWTFSRSYGRGFGNTTSTTAIAESSGAEAFANVNVLPVSDVDPDSSYIIQNPDRPFAIGVKARKAEETANTQKINYFTLSDWGYTVFTY